MVAFSTGDKTSLKPLDLIPIADVIYKLESIEFVAVRLDE
jgi:hypothetical protein